MDQTVFSAELVAAVGVIITTVIGAFLYTVRWITKTFLTELKPNGGHSLNDKIQRLENRVDEIYKIISNWNRERK